MPGQQCGRNVNDVIFSRAIVMGYNLKELDDQDHSLVLSVDILAGIYGGNYTWWNDTVFQELNPNVTFPEARIKVVAR